MSGLFFPLSSYPSALAPYISLLPTTALFEGARQVMVTGSFSIPFSVNLCLSAAGAFVAAVLIFRKKLAE
jgi:lipooligosaccharide transport system permease protein